MKKLKLNNGFDSEEQKRDKKKEYDKQYYLKKTKMANDQDTGIDSCIVQETNKNKLLKQEYYKKNYHNQKDNSVEENILNESITTLPQSDLLENHNNNANEYEERKKLKQNNAIDTEEQKKIRKNKYNKQYYFKTNKFANDQVTGIDFSIVQETNKNKLLKQEYDKTNYLNQKENNVEDNILNANIITVPLSDLLENHNNNANEYE